MAQRQVLTGELRACDAGICSSSCSPLIFVLLGVLNPQTAQKKSTVIEYLFTAVTLPEGQDMQSGLLPVMIMT